MATASELKLEVSVGFMSMTYEIVRPLIERHVGIEGVDDPVDELGPTPTPDSRMKTGDFGICDLNMGYWLAAIDQGWDIVGLPLFVKRKSAYWFMVVRNDRGIAGPKDLEGKRIATRSFRSAIVTWCRGLLKNRHGVDTSTFRWLITDAEDHFPMYDRSAEVEVVTDGRTSVKDQLTRLLEGEVDAFLGDISDPELFTWVNADPRIRRLFPDYRDEDYRLWSEEGIFTPVHMIVLSGKLDREPRLGLAHLRWLPACQGSGLRQPCCGTARASPCCICGSTWRSSSRNGATRGSTGSTRIGTCSSGTSRSATSRGS